MDSIIKLTNGETIVAEIAYQDEKVTSVLEPLMLEISESESGRPMMIALSWIPLTKKVNMVNLNTAHVVAVADCDEEVSSYYKRSLAILKNNNNPDQKIHDLDEMDILEEEEISDPWMEKFGQPIETSANTVH